MTPLELLEARKLYERRRSATYSPISVTAPQLDAMLVARDGGNLAALSGGMPPDEADALLAAYVHVRDASSRSKAAVLLSERTAIARATMLEEIRVKLGLTVEQMEVLYGQR